MVLSARALIRSGTLLARMLYYLNREPMTPDVLVMDYHPNLKDFPKLVKSHLPTLYESPRMRKLFSNDKVQIRAGFRRTKDLFTS